MSKLKAQNKFKIPMINFKTKVLSFVFCAYFVICALEFVIGEAVVRYVSKRSIL